MSVVLVERSFAEPVAFESIEAIADRGAWCFEAHGVRFLKSYFSRDRQRMVCLYEAPDAESVRVAQEKAKLPFEAVWTARVLRHEEAEPAGDTVLVERMLEQPLDEPALRDTAARVAGCLEAYSCRIVWSYLSGDGRRLTCVFAGPDAESVRQSQKLTGLPIARAWPATVHASRPPAR
jgi:hypothetical protein